MEIFNLKEGYFYHNEIELCFNFLKRRIENNKCEMIYSFEEPITVQDTIWKLEHNFPIRIVILNYKDRDYVIKGTNDIKNFEEFINSSNVYNYFGKPFDINTLKKSEKNMMMNNYKVRLFTFCVNEGVEWNESLTKDLLRLI